MRDFTAECTAGALLHDAGKIIYRAGIESGNHSACGAKWLSGVLGGRGDFRGILDCVRYHHASQLRSVKLDADSPAYIVYIADNIAAGADRRTNDEEEGTDCAYFDRNMPLSPVFNILNGNGARGVYPPAELSPQAVYPSEAGRRAEAADYAHIAAKLGAELGKFMTPGGEYVNSLLGLTEVLLSYVPSSTDRRQLADISLYDHGKMTAAAAGCIAEFLAAHGVSDYKKELFDEEQRFMERRAFLMFSCDFSGIQNFIYMVEPKGALKALRSRSFALELFMEHVVDEILGGCGLSRANLIYSGGGHAYMLLPNTPDVLDFLSAAKKRVNRWLADNFGSALYLACAWRPCSAHELQNVPAELSPYSQIYRDLSAELSRVKTSRYDAEELRRLNSRASNEGRECRVCGTSDDLTNEGLCRWCAGFVDISNDALDRGVIISVTKTPGENGHFIELPDVSGRGARFAVFTNLEGARGYAASDEGVRTYSKNNPHTGLNYSTNLYMGDYVYSKEMALLAGNAEGIRRIAVCRADVDNLGRAFIEGFVRKDAKSEEERRRYQTLSRTAAFSRQMSMFFKYHINAILARKDKHVSPLELSGGADGGRNVLIVYSGGDDVFLVGGWDDVIGAACDIESAFAEYTEGALSISAGIGIFGERFPIYRAASLTGELEEASKDVEGKSCVTLFDTKGHTYKWREFREYVLPKVRALAEYIDGGDDFRGKAFLYRLLALARGAEKNSKLDIARCAYLLARAEPKEQERKEKYAEFSNNVMSWMTDTAERARFITAIYLYVYLVRQRSEKIAEL